MGQMERSTSLYRSAQPKTVIIPQEGSSCLPPDWPSEVPLARVTTCGIVSIAVLQAIHPDPDGHLELVYGPPDATVLAEKGSSTALILLSLLASQPDCYAPKDWLSETLHHLYETEEDEDDVHERNSMKRVDNVVSRLRHLLCSPLLNELPNAHTLRRQLVSYHRATSESGPGYRLAGPSLIWLDVEAMAKHIKQARALEQFGHDGFSQWQAAYELAVQGPFLGQEPYSDWASWRRQEVETYLWDCVQALRRHYMEMGESGEIEAVQILRTYWQGHVTSEDALRPLIELLGKREWYGQAEAYYAQLCMTLTQEGKQPDQRTQETITFLRALQIQRESTINKRIQIQSSPPSNAKRLLLPWSSTFGESSEPVQVDILNMMKSRRQLLNELLSTACTVLVLSPYTIEPREKHRQSMIFRPKGDILDVTVLNDLESITEIYWRLCKNASFGLLGSVTEHFQTITHQLKRKQSHETTQCLCQLAGETAQILGKTLFDLHEYALAWSYYTFSLKAAQGVGNHDLWAVGLGRMSLLLIYWEQPQDACALLQEAQQLIIHCPRITCWLAVVEAEVHAQLGDTDACDQALQVAKKLAASELLGEDQYATGMDSSRLAGYEGACFVRLRRPERALPALQHAVAILDPQAIRRQSTIFSDMGKAYAQQGNIQEACTFAIHALALTTQTRSLSVLERVRLVRQELEPWKETESVQELEKHLDATAALITV